MSSVTKNRIITAKTINDTSGKRYVMRLGGRYPAVARITIADTTSAACEMPEASGRGQYQMPIIPMTASDATNVIDPVSATAILITRRDAPDLVPVAGTPRPTSKQKAGSERL